MDLGLAFSLAAAILGVSVLLATALIPVSSPAASEAKPADKPSVSWLHGQIAGPRMRAEKQWHECEHGCARRSCHTICHYR